MLDVFVTTAEQNFCEGLEKMSIAMDVETGRKAGAHVSGADATATLLQFVGKFALQEKTQCVAWAFLSVSTLGPFARISLSFGSALSFS